LTAARVALALRALGLKIELGLKADTVLLPLSKLELE
jgi:hypothetical protein